MIIGVIKMIEFLVFVYILRVESSDFEGICYCTLCHRVLTWR